MSDVAAQIENFFSTFENDESMQAEYSKDPIGFLKSSDLPKEYADELIANLQELRQVSESVSAPTDTALRGAAVEEYGHMSGFVPEKPILTGPQKGKPRITLQKTTNKWHLVTGYYLVLNNQATDDISDGLLAVATLTGLIAAANPEVISKTLAAAIAAALFAEGSAMRIINRGKGVYYYLNPLLLATSGLLVVSLVPLPS